VIHVIAIITAKPGNREAILSSFRDILPEVRAEAGCLEYGPAVDAEGAPAFAAKLGPDTLMVVEKWSSQETLAAHAAAPHMAVHVARVKDLIAARAIHVLDPA
jgi:quinol monooxygenase YgiN